MKLVIKSLSLIILTVSLFLNEASSCEFKKDIKVGLYSGAITELIKHLGLEEKENIIFYSNYFPINNKSAKELSGGIFTSKKLLSEYSVDHVFYDDSRELKLLFERSGFKQLTAIKTAGMTPFEVVTNNLKVLRPLIKNCGEKIKVLEENISKTKKLSLKHKKVIFFLGELKENKLPELIMLQDGFVKYLLQENLIKSYESELAYITWSEKLLNEYIQDNYTLVGLSQSKVVLEIHMVSKNRYNFACNTCLTPGLGQIKFLNALKDTDF
tara:strand:- start:37338 stop:38144 length:807 start_codon:yes stop_codon:yes gene_type:complete